jgi:hypothetical protein
VLAKIAQLLLTGLIVSRAATGFAQSTIRARDVDQFIASRGVNLAIGSSELALPLKVWLSE